MLLDKQYCLGQQLNLSALSPDLLDPSHNRLEHLSRPVEHLARPVEHLARPVEHRRLLGREPD